ncbi:MAG: S1 RNA-binding domain-containing protein, partial [Anaerolineales bacterium]|nr:S1 RNA-binding domain-containing protein [Anaerolineales bacterium]
MSEDSFDMSQEDLASLLEEHDFKAPEVGEIRKGVIVSITPQGIILDLGLKRDGVILPSDLEKLTEEQRNSLETNQEISVYVMSTGGEEGLIVSLHRALQEEDWVRARELLESGEIIEVEVETYNRGGLIVPFGGLRGFIPSSHHTELNPGLNDRARQRIMGRMKGQTMPARVIEVAPERRRLVLSQRDAQKEWEKEKKEELLQTLQEGQVVHGRVTSLSDFGAFVDIGGADGLIHVSELAWHRVNKPSEVIAVGDELDVYILRLDQEGQRISLSRKKLLANPWDSVEERYLPGQLVEVTIT